MAVAARSDQFSGLRIDVPKKKLGVEEEKRILYPVSTALELLFRSEAPDGEDQSFGYPVFQMMNTDWSET